MSSSGLIPDAWPEALKSSVPLVEYYLTHALADIDRSPNARANALRDIAVPILLEIGDAEVLTFYVDLTARLLGYGPDGPEEVRRSLRRNVSPPATRVHQPQASRRDGLTIDRPLAVDPLSVLLSRLFSTTRWQVLRACRTFAART